MNEHERSSHKPDRHRRGPHAEPTRLEQVEDALHRLSKKIGKLNKEQKEMKADLESELAAIKKTRAALAAELAELRTIKEAFNSELKMLRGQVLQLGEFIESAGSGTQEASGDGGGSHDPPGRPQVSNPDSEESGGNGGGSHIPPA